MTGALSHPQPGRTAILVLGMHRSFTSVLTKLIGDLGAALPQDPNPAAPDNPEGYWEPAGIIRLNDHLLRAADSAWLDTRSLTIAPDVAASFAPQIQAALDISFGSASCFVLKDPRICRMVPFYRALLVERGIGLKIVIVLRPPAQVAASLHARNQISPSYTHHLWARHLLDAERQTRDLPRLIVAHDDLILDWHSTATKLDAFLKPETPATDLAALDSPVRPNLYHHRQDKTALSPGRMASLVQHLHDAMRDPVASQARIDDLATEITAVATRNETVLDAEFRFQRLTSPYDAVTAADPLQERQLLSQALGRLHVAD